MLFWFIVIFFFVFFIVSFILYSFLDVRFWGWISAFAGVMFFLFPVLNVFVAYVVTDSIDDGICPDLFITATAVEVDYYEFVFDDNGDVVGVDMVDDDGNILRCVDVDVIRNVNYDDIMFERIEYELHGFMSYIFYMPAITRYKLYFPADMGVWN